MTRRLLLPALLLAGAAASSAAGELAVRLEPGSFDQITAVEIPEPRDGVSVLGAESVDIGGGAILVPGVNQVLERVEAAHWGAWKNGWVPRKILGNLAEAIAQTTARPRLLIILPHHAVVTAAELRVGGELKVLSHHPDERGAHPIQRLSLTQGLLEHLDQLAGQDALANADQALLYDGLRRHVEKGVPLPRSGPPALRMVRTSPPNWKNPAWLRNTGERLPFPRASQLAGELRSQLQDVHQRLGIEAPMGEDDLDAAFGLRPNGEQRALLVEYIQRLLTALQAFAETADPALAALSDDMRLAIADFAVRMHTVALSTHKRRPVSMHTPLLELRSRPEWTDDAATAYLIAWRALAEDPIDTEAATQATELADRQARDNAVTEKPK